MGSSRDLCPRCLESGWACTCRSEQPVKEREDAAEFNPSAFALRVRLAVANANVSMREAARVAGVDKASFHRIAVKEKPPTIDNYLRLCAWLRTVPNGETPKGHRHD